MNTTSAFAETALTSEEVVRASRHLALTRAHVVEAVAGLSPKQWAFQPDNEAWSIAGIVEHLLLIEGRVHAIIANLPNAPHPEPGHKEKELDDFIISEVPKRLIKVKAPATVCPANRCTGPEALAAWMESREQTMQLLAAPLLRGRVMPHPFFGPWDGYQWLLAVASHSARHAHQICERKADPGFPAA